MTPDSLFLSIVYTIETDDDFEFTGKLVAVITRKEHPLITDYLNAVIYNFVHRETA